MLKLKNIVLKEFQLVKLSVNVHDILRQNDVWLKIKLIDSKIPEILLKNYDHIPPLYVLPVLCFLGHNRLPYYRELFEENP